MPFKIVRNDITKMNTEAIVNTANPQPVVGAGCDSAIYRAAGKEELLAYRREKIGAVPEGEVFITPGFGLPAKYIIHAVSPLYVDGRQGEEEKLRSCYQKGLALAEKHGIHSIAFPLISTGSYGYPKEEGMRIAVDEISHFLLDHEMMIELVVFDEKAVELGSRLEPGLEAYIDRYYVDEKRREERTPERPMMGVAMLQAGRAAAPAYGSFLNAEAIPLTPRMAAPEEEFSHEKNGIPDEPAIPPEKENKKSFHLPLFTAKKKTTLKPPAGRKKFLDSMDAFPEKREDSYPEISASIEEAVYRKEAAYRDETVYQKAEADEEAVEYEEAAADTKELEYLDFEEIHESRLEERMKHLSDTFSEYLLYLIKDKNMENADVYKRAIVDKKIFSKIKNNPDYHPKKLTALCLCVGAKLNLDESKDLLARAGYALSPCDKTDIIFSYFIENEIYDMIELDIQLEEHGLPCIIV